MDMHMEREVLDRIWRAMEFMVANHKELAYGEMEKMEKETMVLVKFLDARLQILEGRE